MRAIKCPQCGVDREEGVRKCPRCGARITVGEFVWFYEMEYLLLETTRKLRSLQNDLENMHENFRQNYLDDLDNKSVIDPRAL